MKEFRIDDRGWFKLTIVSFATDENGKEVEVVKSPPQPLDVVSCYNAMSDARERERLKATPDNPESLMQEWESVCELVESWGAGKPSHLVAQRLWDHLVEAINEERKKDKPAQVTTASPG